MQQQGDRRLVTKAHAAQDAKKSVRIIVQRTISATCDMLVVSCQNLND